MFNSPSWGTSCTARSATQNLKLKTLNLELFRSLAPPNRATDERELIPTGAYGVLLISPETDRVAFLVDALETTSRRIDHQIQVFRFAFIRVKPEGLVFHVHLGGR
jgi:hypothetical protein